jgi:hypothetical protein
VSHFYCQSRTPGLIFFLAAGLLTFAAQAQPTIYTCVTPSGKRLTSDRPIPECLAQGQREMRSDGATRRVLPPSLTAEEQARHEVQERKASTVRAIELDSQRRDRNLLRRYPSEDKHLAARQSALEDIDKAISSSQRRVQQLNEERKPLLAESEFYVGKPLPYKVKSHLEANQTAIQAQTDAMKMQRAEHGRINALFDAELQRLKQLWGQVAAPVSSQQKKSP